jgi:hypothetical protein
VRIRIRPRTPVVALLLLAPAIPELLTGSTPVSLLFVAPFTFLFQFGADVALYGTGALLIREFVVQYRKGWASILLLGGAYGIAEEGFAVHTFFQTSGSPVGVLGSYGHAFGVNWLWALGLTVFHATYSIALPILLTNLWFPGARGLRWLDRGAIGLTAFVYLGVVLLFSRVVGHGPTPATLAFFLVIVAILLALAWIVPADLLRVRTGPTRASREGLVVAGAGGFLAWVAVLFFAGAGRAPAVFAALELGVVDLAVLGYVTRFVGRSDLERAEFYFTTGMLGILFVWDVPVEFSIPGIIGVAILFAYLQYRLGRRIRGRGPIRNVGGPLPPPSPPPGAIG